MYRALVALFFLVIAFNTFGQSFSPTFQYPVRVGSESWNNAKSYEELRRLNQIPAQEIKKMDTRSLLRNVLNYPLIGDLFLYNSFKLGFYQLRNNFYAFDSLLNRKDLMVAVFLLYESIDLKEIDSIQSNIQTMEFKLRISFLEELIWHLHTTSAINSKQSDHILNILIHKYNIKKELIDKYGVIGVSTSLWAISKLNYKAKASSSWIEEFTENGYLLDLEKISIYENQLLK